VEQRLRKLREKLAKHNLDGLVIESPYNRRYLSGFTGTAGVLLIGMSEAKLMTDFRYVEQATEQAPLFEIVEHKIPIVQEAAKQAEKMGIKKLGFEQEQITYQQYQMYQKQLKIEFVPVSEFVEELRLVKDEQEITILKEAAKIADDAFAHIIRYIRAGVTELDVANELEFFMRKQGATSSSFDIIVASGVRSALPHGVASEKKIQKGELVTLDFGAYYKGYCSDITRTIAVGDVSDKLKEIYDTVLAAQLCGMNGIKAGITGKEADALTRDYIEAKGYGEYFGHSTGHGIGLEIHEGPTLSMRSNLVLKEGMVVTVEPGIYIAGVGGTRIEDDIIITAKGNEPLTKSPKQFIVVDA